MKWYMVLATAFAVLSMYSQTMALYVLLVIGVLIGGSLLLG